MIKPIPYGRQNITDHDINAVVEVLKSDFLTQGPKIIELENKFANYVGSKYSVAVSNGTAALHLVALAYGWKKGDIVITTPMSFVATANCIEYTGAKPYFIDIEAKTGNISTINLEKTLKKLNKTNKKVKAVICVDYAGSICDWKSLKKISRKYKVNLINDNCHAIGSRLEGDQGYALKYADVVTHSYHPAKNITTGEGGSVLTNDKKIYEKILTLRTHGIKKLAKNRLWYYEMQNLGFNYRLSDLQSALGSSQLKRLNLFIKKRNYIADKYNKSFRNMRKIQLVCDSFNIPCYHRLNHGFHAKVKDQEDVYHWLADHPAIAEFNLSYAEVLAGRLSNHNDKDKHQWQTLPGAHPNQKGQDEIADMFIDTMNGTILEDIEPTPLLCAGFVYD